VNRSFGELGEPYGRAGSVAPASGRRRKGRPKAEGEKLSETTSYEGVAKMHLFTKVKNFLRDESGASAVEYGLLVAGIAVVVMGSVYLIGTNLNTKFGEVATQLQGS
jgi:pilus assembly protein Flp/PilA